MQIGCTRNAPIQTMASGAFWDKLHKYVLLYDFHLYGNNLLLLFNIWGSEPTCTTSENDYAITTLLPLEESYKLEKWSLFNTHVSNRRQNCHCI
jgi:hypothetical protein